MPSRLSEIDRQEINNDYYQDLGVKWYTAQDDPVALLRAEARPRNRWVLETILKQGMTSARILDVGCGGGFLSNFLSEHDFAVTGLDLSTESLEVARRFDRSGAAQYIHGDAYEMPFPDQTFDVVTCMDFLEHVSKPATVISEVARVLKPGGLFFFHTFNRNWLSWLIVIKGVEWFVKNTPRHLHIKKMFIKPRELRYILHHYGFEIQEMKGLRPQLNGAFLKMLRTREVPDNFRFVWTSSTWMSYTGWARKVHS